MKKVFLTISIILVVIAAGCSDSSEDKAGDNMDEKETQEVNENTESNEEQDEEVIEADQSESADEVKDLSLQLQRLDEEAGVTIEDNEIYSVLDEAIKADPKMGISNDFSLFPFDIVINEDGSNSLLFLAINRLEEPIKNLSFEMTFGNQNGEYIWEDSGVTFPEEQFGVLKPDHAMPFMLDITQEQVDLYDSLDMDNVHMEMANYSMDVVE
ncbi:hypothetical protein ACUL41_15340 [Virgibacillus natechei]